MQWSPIETPTLKGRHCFRQLVPAVIEDFVGNHQHEYYGPSVRIADVAGSRVGNASWEIHTDCPDVDSDSDDDGGDVHDGPVKKFTLLLNGRREAKIRRMEGRLIVRSPSGDILNKFAWQTAKLVSRRHIGHIAFLDETGTRRGDSDDSDDGYPDPDDYGVIGSVSVKDATENGWLFDGVLHVCVVDVKFKLKPASAIPLTSTAAATTGRDIMSMLRGDLDDPPFSDFVLISADGQRTQTYKLLLATVSPVFRAMFHTDCKETREGCCKVGDADGETIKTILACVLGASSCNFRLMGFGLLQKLAILADKYEILKLKDDCETQLASNVSMDNVFDFLQYASLYSSPQLRIAGFVLLEESVKRKEEVTDKLKEIGGAAEKPLHEEFLYHFHLRYHGGPRKRAEKSADKTTESECMEE